MNRKQHSNDLGYVAERKNPFADRKVVIYVATEIGIDVDGCKYAVVCDDHGVVVGTTSIPKARILMKNPDNFCDECRALSQQ